MKGKGYGCINSYKGNKLFDIVLILFDKPSYVRHNLIYISSQRNTMATKEKKQVLKEQGLLNRQPSKVIDPTYRDNPFFDPDDLAQVKYEMVRQVCCEGISVSEAALNFGMSRPTVYLAREAIEQEGLLGLAPKKSGPQSRHKLTAEVMAFVHEKIGEDKSVNSQRLAEMLKERFSISIHPRSIERALAAEKKRANPDKER
jgi:transposase